MLGYHSFVHGNLSATGSQIERNHDIPKVAFVHSVKFKQSKIIFSIEILLKLPSILEMQFFQQIPSITREYAALSSN